MNLHLSPVFKLRAGLCGLVLCVILPAGFAQAPKPGGAKPARKASAHKAPPKPAEFTVPAASAEQTDAADQVFYGVYECEFKQTVQIVANLKHPSYVDVRHGKAAYLMKPVLSSTGAIRLEDVRGQTLMVQISSKSMLLNVKTGQREVDECISPRQRELVEAARAAKVDAAAAAAAAASAPAAAAVSPAASPVAAAASAAVESSAAEAATPASGAQPASEALPASAAPAASTAPAAPAATSPTTAPSAPASVPTR